MIQSRITAKAQTTIPRAVRDALGVGPGDKVGWEIEDGHVVVRRLAPAVRDPFLANFSTFTEWADELDAVYDNL